MLLLRKGLLGKHSNRHLSTIIFDVKINRLLFALLYQTKGNKGKKSEMSLRNESVV